MLLVIQSIMSESVAHHQHLISSSGLSHSGGKNKAELKWTPSSSSYPHIIHQRDNQAIPITPHRWVHCKGEGEGDDGKDEDEEKEKND